MVEHRPYLRYLCARCSKAVALAYYRNGGQVIYASRRLN
jgi:DNA-directed RNA polymerase subunit RPC12/RpoP